MAHVSKRYVSSQYSTGETCFVQRDWLGKAAPPNSHKQSGAEGESARREEEIKVGVETQHRLMAATDKLQRIQKYMGMGMLGQQQTHKWKNTANKGQKQFTKEKGKNGKKV